MATNASQSEVDCTCPVCCDIFTDPVILLCGHSFCKDCLQQWWRESRLQTCPVCKEIFPMAQPPRNLRLRNLSDTLRQKRSQRANSGSEEMCSLHGERLKLFCQDDQQLICVICRDSQKHKKHNFDPINEAAEALRAELKLKTLHLKTKLGSFQAHKLNYDKMASHIKLQAQQTEKTIKEEFLKLYQFLRAEEAARIDAVRKEATLKSEAMNIEIVNLTAEISSLEDRIRTIEREMMAEDISFMLNVRSTMKRSQYNLPDPETPSGALMDEAKHLGNLLFTVWRKMKDIIQYTPVTLDPNTGGSILTISEHMTRLTGSNKSHPLPKNPERLQNSDVLGSEGFSSGKHSWDVELQAQQTEKTIKEEFLKLYQFLRAEEAARIDAVRKEATLKSEAVNIRIVNLTAEISSLEDRIRTIEREMMAEDISFMLNVRSTMKRSQCKLPDPETPSGALMDEAKHLGNLLFTVWRKMKDIIQYTPVTLDPNTGDPLLIISEHMTRSTENKTKPLPRNPERRQTWDVLGSEGFGSGKHSWDVEVGLDCWAVGVAARTKNPKGFWGILRHATDILLEYIQQDYDRIDFKGREPQKIRVHLDYDQGILSFFDLDRKRPVHTIKHTFTKTVFPYFRGNVKILPAVVSVKIRT
ncbi:E3 ubiquitin-protein ligase TRIM35-like [Epinephelus lanceolatus]